MDEHLGERLKKLIEKSGFESIGAFKAAELKVEPEVRAMCAVNTCQAYGKNWACPPACGSLEEYEERFSHYLDGYVFQTIAQMEDAFDFEAIEAAGAEHKRRFHLLVDETRDFGSATLLLGAGHCSICPECSCPDAPCRFPDKVYPSMEAAGLLVSAVCNLADVPYYHGPGTVAFCSAALY
ncbi:MAG: DUF2284 domain-containing protein [Coriobacteriales bacterium]|jgi:predicted metal-binding protein|nr:DUF2284 domain-containing protein [Coriobacteriales bacterium]